MNRFFAAAAVAVLIATPVLAQTTAPQPPAAPMEGMHRGEQQRTMDQMHRDGGRHEQMGQMHREGARHQHVNRTAAHRGNREVHRMGAGACPADGTDEAGGAAHAGGYCLPGGRS